jgi:hypothetical protein
VQKMNWASRYRYLWGFGEGTSATYRESSKTTLSTTQCG